MSEAAGMEQWLFTFDSATGRVSRVERLDPLSGEKQELSQAEYAALDSYLSALLASSDATRLSDSPSAWRAIATQRAYLQGVADCAALYRQYGLSR